MIRAPYRARFAAPLSLAAAAVLLCALGSSARRQPLPLRIIEALLNLELFGEPYLFHLNLLMIPVV